MNALISLVIVSLLLTVAAGRSIRKCDKWSISMCGREIPQQDAAISQVHKEEWPRNPKTFQDQVNGAIPEDSMKRNGFRNEEQKRASGYKDLQDFLEDFDQ